MASKVYFADLRADYHENLQQKLTRLMKTAGMGNIDFQDKYVAIKLHFGEPGNMAYLRPNWARVVCDYVRELGGKPFLTDCNTLYVGGRANALDHLDSAMRNGYSPMTTGAQCIIADGLKGEDYALVPIRGGTDGARLSWDGLPCPNLSTGGYNYHGVREWIPADSLEAKTNVLVTLTESFAE